MYQKEYRFELQAVTPLIMHRDDIFWADYLKEERTRIKAHEKAKFIAGDDRCPVDTWKGYCYHDGERLALPHDVLHAMMIKAGTRVILKNQKTYKQLVASSMLFNEMYIEFFNNGKPVLWKDIEGIKGTFSQQAKGAVALGFQLLAKRASVGQSKHVRVRPKFDHWTMRGMFLLLDEQLEEVIHEIWNQAGMYVGGCDWRPGSPKSPGPYGKFAATITAV